MLFAFKLFVFSKKVLLAVVVATALGTITGPVLAHDHRHVGDYNFVVGFIIEPTYEGLPNGVDVRVTKFALDEGEHGHRDHTAEANTEVKTPSQDMPMNQGDGIADVEGHGALFVSPGLMPGDSFSYQPDHAMEGVTIPYHNHLNHDMTGTITVIQDASAAGSVEVAIDDEMFMPADITVRAETIITWTNRATSPQSVTSGLAPTADHADGEVVERPVEGLEETLQLEITHVPTGQARVLELRSVAGSPGHYAADLIPTAQGVYEMRVFGSIDGDAIDETFISYGGGGGFSDVLPASDLQFPEQWPEVREIEGAVRGALATAQKAQDAALSAQGASANSGNPSANMLGIIGIVLGAVGFVAGAGGLTMAMRNR